MSSSSSETRDWSRCRDAGLRFGRFRRDSESRRVLGVGAIFLGAVRVRRAAWPRRLRGHAPARRGDRRSPQPEFLSHGGVRQRVCFACARFRGGRAAARRGGGLRRPRGRAARCRGAAAVAVLSKTQDDFWRLLRRRRVSARAAKPAAGQGRSGRCLRTVPPWPPLSMSCLSAWRFCSRAKFERAA